MTELGPTNYGDYQFPVWADSLGWMMGASTLAPFPIFVVYRYFKANKDWRVLFKPTIKWRPQNSVQNE